MIRCLALLCAVVASPALAGDIPFDATGVWPQGEIACARAALTVLPGEDGFDVNTGVIGCAVGSGQTVPEYEASPI